MLRRSVNFGLPRAGSDIETKSASIGRWRGFVRVVVAMVTTMMLALTSTQAFAATFPEPADDPFYEPPVGIARYAPGTVIRSRPITAMAGVTPLPADAWQILTRSNDSLKRPVAVVATLMIPTAAYSGTGPRPLLSYQVAINSLGDQCNPSYSLRSGSSDGDTQVELSLVMQQALECTESQRC
jgi:hypothetical protein